MGFNATFYKFAKRKNSTKLPTGGTSKTIELKDTTNILRPTILLNQTTFPDYNYCHMAEFNRYYYINDIRWANGIWELDMIVDVLASYRTEIGNQSLYVTRSAQEFDGDVLDTVYPATSETTYDRTTASSSPWITDDLENGCYVVGIAGVQTTYYAFFPSALESFLRYIFSDTYVSAVLGSLGLLILNPETKLQVNPLQYITSIMWFPFVYTGTPVTSIDVGFVPVTVTAGKVDGSGIANVLIDFTTKDHPQIARGDYMNNAPYSSYSLYYPPFGLLDLDPNFVANNDEILTTVNVDMRTGGATLTVQGDLSLNPEARIEGKVGVNYQVSQVVNSGDLGLQSTLGALTGMVGSKSTADVSAKAIGGLVDAIGDYARGKIPKANTIGSMGGLNSLRGTPSLLAEFKTVIDEDRTNKGRPLCETKTLNTLTGYIQVADAVIQIAAETREIDEIISYMEGGFYLE